MTWQFVAHALGEQAVLGAVAISIVGPLLENWSFFFCEAWPFILTAQSNDFGRLCLIFQSFTLPELFH